MTKPLSVLLIDDNPARAEIVEAGLRNAGYRLVARLGGTQDLPRRVGEVEPDVIVVSIDSPSRDTIEDMRRSTEQQPRPIALFVDRSDPATIAAAMEAGVSAYVVKGLAEDRVRSVVDVAVGHFNRYHAMREELERARLTLLERKIIDRAKGLLMEQRAMAEDAAYKLLRPFVWGTPRFFFADGGFYRPGGRAQLIAVKQRAPAYAPKGDAPFSLNTGRVRDQWHKMTRTGKSARLAGHRPEPLSRYTPQSRPW